MKLSGMELTITRNMLRDHVGRRMFCPACQAVLDVSRSVEIDFHNPAGDLVHSGIRCSKCFDRIDWENVSVGKTLTRTIHDGRELFARTK
jgi:hypothetical protein